MSAATAAASTETDIMVAQSLAASLEPRGEPRRKRTVSGLNIISMTVPTSSPPATRDAILRGILKPEVVRPSTPDLRLAQNATGVNEAAQSITAADELLAKLKQVEKTLRVEVEQVEEALRKHIDPDADPDPAQEAAADSQVDQAKLQLDAQNQAMRAEQFDKRLAAQERQTDKRIDSAMQRELLKMRR